MNFFQPSRSCTVLVHLHCALRVVGLFSSCRTVSFVLFADRIINMFLLHYRSHCGCGQRVSNCLLYWRGRRPHQVVWLQRLHEGAVGYRHQRQRVLCLRLQGEAFIPEQGLTRDMSVWIKFYYYYFQETSLTQQLVIGQRVVLALPFRFSYCWLIVLKKNIPVVFYVFGYLSKRNTKMT